MREDDDEMQGMDILFKRRSFNVCDLPKQSRLQGLSERAFILAGMELSFQNPSRKDILQMRRYVGKHFRLQKNLSEVE